MIASLCLRKNTLPVKYAGFRFNLTRTCFFLLNEDHIVYAPENMFKLLATHEWICHYTLKTSNIGVIQNLDKSSVPKTGRFNHTIIMNSATVRIHFINISIKTHQHTEIAFSERIKFYTQICIFYKYKLDKSINQSGRPETKRNNDSVIVLPETIG